MGSAFCWLSHWNVMQGYFHFSISKPRLAYVEEGGFNEKIPRRQNLPTGRNIQGHLKMRNDVFRRRGLSAGFI